MKGKALRWPTGPSFCTDFFLLLPPSHSLSYSPPLCSPHLHHTWDFTGFKNLPHIFLFLSSLHGCFPRFTPSLVLHFCKVFVQLIPIHGGLPWASQLKLDYLKHSLLSFFKFFSTALPIAHTLCICLLSVYPHPLPWQKSAWGQGFSAVLFMSVSLGLTVVSSR